MCFDKSAGGVSALVTNRWSRLNAAKSAVGIMASFISVQQRGYASALPPKWVQSADLLGNGNLRTERVTTLRNINEQEYFLYIQRDTMRPECPRVSDVMIS